MFIIFMIYQLPCVWLPHRKRCCACYWEDVRRSLPTVHGWEATSTYCWLVTLPSPSHRCSGKDMFFLSHLYGHYHQYFVSPVWSLPSIFCLTCMVITIIILSHLYGHNHHYFASPVWSLPSLSVIANLTPLAKFGPAFNGELSNMSKGFWYVVK